jgi:xyloglucan-specific endo-beta-1,4-glucanase
LDQWGLSGATSGLQCASLTSLTGNTVGFKTNWTFAGGNGVKSYTNIELTQGLNKVLSSIGTIPSTFSWTNTASGSIVADVAYDLFTSTAPGGSTQNNFEIMVWLANYNAGPISYNYGADGSPTPVASNLVINGHAWNLYYGYNGWNYVYSFLPVSGTIPSFSGDLNLFLKVCSSVSHDPCCERNGLTAS